MRFIYEFAHTLELYSEPDFEVGIANYKARGALDISKKISESLGWQERHNPFKIIHTLEIEAFPMDKWVEFKNALFSHMDDPAMGQISPVYILQLIKHLESFGKPDHEQSKTTK